MLYKRIHTYIIALVVTVFVPGLLTGKLIAQDMNKEVYVVSSYKPEIADADRIATMPLIADTFSFNTQTDYTLLPSRLQTEFAPRPIKPAKMVGTPLDKLYNSYARAGFGNYTTPMFEYSIHNLRSKEYAVGAWVYHKSSHKKRDIANISDVPAGYGHNRIAFYGKRFYKGYTVSGEVGAWNHKIRHYGISPILGDTLDVTVKDIRQNYKSVYGTVGINSAHTDSSQIQYSALLTGEHFSDRYDNVEPHVQVTGSINIPVSWFRIGFDAGLDYYNQNVEGDSATQTLFSVYPNYSMQGKNWRLKAGPRIVFLNTVYSQKTYFFLDGIFEYNIIPQTLTGIAGLTGYIEPNTNGNMYKQNPYIIPGLYTENTRYPVVMHAGVKGRISRLASYRAGVRFENIYDMVYFVNSDTNSLQNQYSVKTIDTDRIRYHGEIGWEPMSYLKFFMNVNYYSYKVPDYEEAWHKPSFDLNFAASYTYKDKISATLEYLYYGERKAENIQTTNQVITLSAINDINLKIDYKFSGVLDIFLHFYNLTNQKYQLWNQYPVQGINIMLGAGYKF